MNFEGDLRLLVGRHDVGLERVVGGVVRVKIKKLIDFVLFDSLLRKHDKTLVMTNAGTIELHPLSDIGMLGAADITAGTTRITTSGAIREVTRLMPIATTPDLLALVALPHVLSVALASGVLVVNEIVPSDIVDGLAHLKRKGRLNTNKRQATKAWPAMSTSLRKAQAARRRRAWW